MHKLIYLVVPAVLATTPVLADDEIRRLGDALKACYHKAGLTYALSSCHAPSELVPAIRSKCRPEITAAHSYVQNKSNLSVADDTMAGVLAKIEEDVTAVIVDGQTARSQCRN